MNYVCGIVLISSLTFLLAPRNTDATELWEVSEKTINVKGLKKGTPISIFQIGKTGRSLKVAECNAPCAKTVKLAEPFFISISTRQNKYETFARRNSDSARRDNETYWIDATLKSSDEEADNYFSLYAKDHNYHPDRKTCLEFSVEDLNERPKACFKNQPLMPAKMRRSGWCAVHFIVTTLGSTQNVEVSECSEEIFRRSSLQAAKEFRYYPRLKDGVVAPAKLKTKVKFTLFNDKGKRIPARGE